MDKTKLERASEAIEKAFEETLESLKGAANLAKSETTALAKEVLLRDTLFLVFGLLIDSIISIIAILMFKLDIIPIVGAIIILILVLIIATYIGIRLINILAAPRVYLINVLRDLLGKKQ